MDKRKPHAELAAPIDRLPPHDLPCEIGVLGCIILNAQECMPEVTAKCPAEAFYSLQNRMIYERLVQMHGAGEAIDMITLQARLKDAQQLDAVGGLPYLASLPDAVPSAANLDYYLSILLEKYTLRCALKLCADTEKRIYDGHDPEAVVDRLEHDVMQLSRSKVGECDWEIKTAVHEAVDDIQTAHNSQGMLPGIGTGLIDLDKMTGGLHVDQMVVIAGRPSVGKSSIALNIAEHVCVELNLPVGLFSFEMAKKALLLRMISSRARVNVRNIRDGFLAERDFPKVTGAAGRLHKAPFYVDDSPSQNIAQVRSKARRMKQQHGIMLLVIDYFQRVHGLPGVRYRSEQEELKDISNILKEIALELHIPVLVLSQLNREVEKDRKARKPRMSDLRGSGQLEQDADVIGLLYRASRDNRYRPADDDEGSRESSVPVNLLIEKQRDGETGDVHLIFLKCWTRFESAAKIADDDIPEDQQLPYKD